MAKNIRNTLRHRNVTALRMRTKMEESIAASILSPYINPLVRIEEAFYSETEHDQFHECDLIYFDKSGVPEENIPKGYDVEKHPVLIYIHGGGWTVGDRKMRRGLATKYAEAGFFVLSINYRLAPEHKHPAQVDDVYKAINYAYAISERYNLDMNNLFLGGDSAGAHIAALSYLCTVDTSLKNSAHIQPNLKPHIVGLLLICGVYNFRKVMNCRFQGMRKFLKAYSGTSIKKFVTGPDSKLLSPIYYAEEFPPCFLVTGENDRLKPETEHLVCKLCECDKKFNLFIGRGLYSFHVFPAAFYAPMAAKCIAKSIKYLKSLIQ